MCHRRSSQGLIYIVSLATLSIFGRPAAAQTSRGVGIDDLVAAMERLQISLPMSVAGRDPVRRHLAELNREACDQKAIFDLGNALDAAGYRREAANAHIRFSATCGGHANSLRAAVNIFLKLSDYTNAVTYRRT